MIKSIVPVCLLALMSVGFLFTGCSAEEGFATNPMGNLSFSADTLSFDTVFSKVGTPTAWMCIYNKADKPIRISTISLKEGNKGFRINVDGQNSTNGGPVNTFHNIDIPARDSLFLFVELTPAEQKSLKPMLLSDAILFQAEGKQKQLVLEAYSQDAHFLRSLLINRDTTLTADQPYLVYDSLVVAKDATLTIDAGATFYMHNKANLIVRGKIKALGTLAMPITFRGDRLDAVFSDITYDLYPGQWGSIRLAATSFGNQMDYVHILGGKTGILADSSSVDQEKLKMTNSVVHNMSEYGLWSCNAKMSMANTQITNTISHTVCLIGGVYDFTHCTIANYLSIESRKGLTLLVSNYQSGLVQTPLALKADFHNSIVFGSGSFEIDTLKSTQVGWKLQFLNCMLRSKEWTSDMALGCLYPNESRFVKLGLKKTVQNIDERDYRYDFRLDSLSQARSAADPVFSAQYPLDKNGVSRLEDGKPDIGAYEWKKITIK